MGCMAHPAKVPFQTRNGSFVGSCNIPPSCSRPPSFFLKSDMVQVSVCVVFKVWVLDQGLLVCTSTGGGVVV